MTLLGENTIQILKRALSLIDSRIVDHGDRLAYILMEMLKAEGGYSEREIINICFLSTLHDIGAFKKEELDAITNSEIENGFECDKTVHHCVYGYLFIKKFSTLTEYADAILYHHTAYTNLLKYSCKNKSLAAKIFVADRFDILISGGGAIVDDTLFEAYRDTIFLGTDIDILIELEKTKQISKRLQDKTYVGELNELYKKIDITGEECMAYIRTVIYAIDFRSRVTVVHTITTASLSVEIARLEGISGEELEKISIGSLLHDIGKISTPLNILEKEGSLTSDEYLIMKQHVVMSEEILTGLIDYDVVKIAVRHHEKCNGIGYPRGLVAVDLTVSENIVAVSDIISALVGKRSYKEPFTEDEVKSIIFKMAAKGELDKNIVRLVLDNYSQIMKNVNIQCEDVIKQYSSISDEYDNIYEKFLIGYKE